MQQYDYDLLIAGGGLIGASLACAVSGQGLRIGLIERHLFATAEHPSYDDRSLALGEGTRRIFETLGLWSKLATTPILDIHISEQGSPGVVRIDHHDEGVSALGFVVEARRLSAHLMKRLTQLPDVELLCPAQLEAVRLHPDMVHARLQLNDCSAALTTRLLVAADGAHSYIRQHLGIDVLRRDYHQSAVIANLSTQLPHCNVAYERFGKFGAMALLPMSDQRCSLVYTVSEREIDMILALDDQAFLERIQRSFGDRLGRLLKVGRRSAYPLHLIKAYEHHHPRLVIIGNAAHTLHPIAGQGFNLGMRDVAVLAEVISNSWFLQHDIGSQACLQHYADWRRWDQHRAVLFTDGLTRLFRHHWILPKLVRSYGLTLFDLLPSAKHTLAQQAMGIAGRLPRLARGLPLPHSLPI
jgi:2-octaprenyl-6-methoxyphenol hydroxylase